MNVCLVRQVKSSLYRNNRTTIRKPIECAPWKPAGEDGSRWRRYNVRIYLLCLVCVTSITQGDGGRSPSFLFVNGGSHAERERRADSGLLVTLGMEAKSLIGCGEVLFTAGEKVFPRLF